MNFWEGEYFWRMAGNHLVYCKMAKCFGNIWQTAKITKSLTECSANSTKWLSLSANVWRTVPNEKIFSANAWRLIKQFFFDECLAISRQRRTFQRILALHSPNFSATVHICDAFAYHSSCIRQNHIFYNKGG